MLTHFHPRSSSKMFSKVFKGFEIETKLVPCGKKGKKFEKLNRCNSAQNII